MYNENVTVARDLYAKNVQVEKRKYTRAHYINNTRYHIVGQDKIHTGLSVDISKGGLGMITYHPLEVGTILVFEEEVRLRIKNIINNISVTAVVARWIREMQKSRKKIDTKWDWSSLDKL